MRVPVAALLALALAPAAGGDAPSPPAARGPEPLLVADVEARDVPGPLAADPAAPLWDAIPAREVTAVPQRTVRLADRDANEALAAAGPRLLAVRAACDGRDLAIAVDWGDPTEDRSAPDATDAFGDAAALEVPLRFGAGLRLPYVGMGDDAMPVALYLARASAAGTTGREAVAAGFGSLTRADLGGAKVAMRRDAARKAWRAVFLRPLEARASDLRRGLVPFALAVWDGARRERGGNKALTGWKLLRLPRFPADAGYAAELQRVRAPAGGDAARGKALAEGVCAACHAFAERRAAPPGVAPGLDGIGAIATPGYLRESLVDPSAVIVPSPNPNQHQDRSARPGVSGAYPNDERFVWWRRGESGERISKMPSFGALPAGDLDAIVAYLVTLGVEAPGAGRKP
ncbi:MAG TPA: c-type cytochrome [Anaeromyxobacteraceae bacterium]|nr:c-type cytochrome [Anaeromyxobacteraceae bacterium]